MSRVISLKGEASNEKAIFVRLYLLQGILMFHENLSMESYRRLASARAQLLDLQVNEKELLFLTGMGYGTTESRVALRSCQNDAQKAIEMILDRREKRTEAKNKWKKENASVRKAGGQRKKWVNPRMVQTLVEMGFAENISAAALRKSENNVPVAVSTFVKRFFQGFRRDVYFTKPFFDFFDGNLF